MDTPNTLQNREKIVNEELQNYLRDRIKEIGLKSGYYNKLLEIHEKI